MIRSELVYEPLRRSATDKSLIQEVHFFSFLDAPFSLTNQSVSGCLCFSPSAPGVCAPLSFLNTILFFTTTCMWRVSDFLLEAFVALSFPDRVFSAKPK